MAGAAHSFEKSFPLPAAAILAGSSATLDLASETSGDVAQAIIANIPFPDREIRLGGISLAAEAGKDVALGTKGAKVTLGASFGVDSGIAVLNTPKSVLKTLNIGADTPLALEAALGDSEGATRYVVFLAGYEATGSIKGTHPIGAFGSVSFGAAGQRKQLYAVVHRIASNTGALTAIENTVGSFRLPRQVDQASDLEPGTMLVAEVNGSMALNLATTFGYDFNFVRDLESIGLSGDIGLRLQLGFQAALGFLASGRYLVSIDRASIKNDSQQLRLRLFKLSQKGLDFGLNLSATATTRADLPENVDDFVRAVFGLQGQQVIADLKRIEDWTDPKKDLSDIVAGLTSEKGLELLQQTTGIDPEKQFKKAHKQLVDALKLWESVPERGLNAAWKLLSEVSGEEELRTKAVTALSAISAQDDKARRSALLELIGRPNFESTPVGGFLTGLADRGLLGLLDDSELPKIAARVQRILDGSTLSQTLETLQGYIDNALNLGHLRAITKKADFDQVNDWLIGRLSAFLDDKLAFEKLDDVKDQINKVLEMRQLVYDKARKALNHTYEFSLAATWQRSTSKETLLDAEFDMGDDTARSLFRAVVREANYDRLLTEVASGVTLRNAAMSHEIERSSSVEVNLPFYNSTTTTFNESIAKVAAEDDNGRVLVYSLDAKDKVTRLNRFTSQLGVGATLSLPVAGVRRHSEKPQSSWSYSYRLARSRIRAGEVESRLRPLVEQYFPNHFPEGADSSLHQWIGDVDRQVEGITGNGPTIFGDTLISVEVGLSSDVIAPWVAQRTKTEALAAAKRVSIRLQEKLRELLSFYYFQDLDHLHLKEPTCALLVWSSLRTANDISLKNGRVVDDTGSKDVFWDWMDLEKRTAMVLDPTTFIRLHAVMAEKRAELLAAGRTSQAGLFQPGKIGAHIDASNYRGKPLFHSLLFSEKVLVDGARSALIDISNFWKNSATAPSRAIQRLAEFGEEITSTFNSRLSNTYGSKFLRPLGSMLFLEAARALDPALETASPDALLSLTVLKENIDYDIASFLDNVPPNESDVAVQQRLVAAG